MGPPGGRGEVWGGPQRAGVAKTQQNKMKKYVFSSPAFCIVWGVIFSSFFTNVDVFVQCVFDVCSHRFFVVFEGVLQVFFEDMAKMEKWIWTGKN